MRGRTVLATVRVATTFAGTIIGAGFASGQELLQFFAAYGGMGLAGLALAGILFSWLGTKVLHLGYRLQATSYHQLLYHLCGKKTGLLLDVIIASFLFSVLTIMLAGAGTVFRDSFGLSFELGITLLAVLVTAISLRGVAGIAAANMIAAPILILSVLSISIYSLYYHQFTLDFLYLPPDRSNCPAPHWVLSSILYVSYNLVMGMTVLAPLGASTPSKSCRRWGGMAGGAILALMGMLVTITIMQHYPGIMAQEIPMLYISSIQHCANSTIYTLMFITAMMTTALASLYGCATKLTTAAGVSFPLSLIVIVSCSIAFSQIGFANLIAVLFPIFGYAMLWFLIRLVVCWK